MNSVTKKRTVKQQYHELRKRTAFVTDGVIYFNFGC